MKSRGTDHEMEKNAELGIFSVATQTENVFLVLNFNV